MSATAPPFMRPCAASNSRRTASSSAVSSVSARSPVSMAGAPRRHRAGEHAHADKERLLLLEDACPVEHILERARLGQRPGEPPLQRRPIRQAAKERRLDQRVEHMGALDDGFGERGAVLRIIASSDSSPFSIAAARRAARRPACARGSDRRRRTPRRRSRSSPAPSISVGTNSVSRSRALAERVAG